jgi:hypothetical protein
VSYHNLCKYKIWVFSILYFDIDVTYSILQDVLYYWNMYHVLSEIIVKISALKIQNCYHRTVIRVFWSRIEIQISSLTDSFQVKTNHKIITLQTAHHNSQNKFSLSPSHFLQKHTDIGIAKRGATVVDSAMTLTIQGNVVHTLDAE